jgi:molecular chaperone HscA
MLLDITEPENNISKKEVAIGIDLGTTNSLIAISKDGKPKIIDFMASIVDFENISIRSIKRLIGKSYDEASAILDSNPELKQFLLTTSGDIRFSINHQETTPAQISSIILAKLKSSAEEFLGESVTKAVITIPAYFDDAARNETKLAAELGGLEVLRLIAEPTAAAFAYGLENGKEGFFLVYDFGGGTFDVSLLNMQMGVFQVVATGGDLNLGGDDIDLAIAKYVEARCITTLTDVIPAEAGIHEQNITLDSCFHTNDNGQIDDKSQTTLLPFARKAKETFSSQDNFTCEHFSLSKAEFEQITKDIINKTIKIVENVIDDSGISAEDIEGIIMVGGSTRIPLIKQILSQKFGLKIFDDVDPDKVVALGAALQAENLTSGASNLLIDVTPLSLGIELMGGLVDVMIPRNSALPASKSVEFTTHADNQTAMKFHIVQGDRALAKDCRSLAHFEIKNIDPMKAKMARIKLEFFVDVDGILSVTATNQMTGENEKITLRPSYGLSEEEAFKMLRAAFENAKEDHKQALLIKARNEANDLLLAVRKFEKASEIEYYLSDLEDKMKTENYEEIIASLSIVKGMAIDFFNENLKQELSKEKNID